LDTTWLGSGRRQIVDVLHRKRNALTERVREKAARVLVGQAVKLASRASAWRGDSASARQLRERLADALRQDVRGIVADVCRLAVNPSGATGQPGGPTASDEAFVAAILEQASKGMGTPPLRTSIPLAGGHTRA
jgi:hypothetical protein